jgi:hypothetical protein
VGKNRSWVLALSSWPLRSRSKGSSVSKRSLRRKPHPKQQPQRRPRTAKSQEPKANGRTQVLCFQDFACKSHGLKILSTNFFASPMESRFYGYPGGGVRSYQPPAVSYLVRLAIDGIWLAAGSWRLTTKNRSLAPKDGARDDKEQERAQRIY